jgi:hypothetical protein
MLNRHHSWLSFGRGHASATGRYVEILDSKSARKYLTTDVTKSREVSFSSSMTLSLKLSPCQVRLLDRNHRSRPVDPTLFPLIIGPGNVPRASVELVFKIRWRFEGHSGKAYEREYPSGAICLLTMETLASGPIEKDSAQGNVATARVRRKRNFIEKECKAWNGSWSSRMGRPFMYFTRVLEARDA